LGREGAKNLLKQAASESPQSLLEASSQVIEFVKGSSAPKSAGLEKRFKAASTDINNKLKDLSARTAALPPQSQSAINTAIVKLADKLSNNLLTGNQGHNDAALKKLIGIREDVSYIDKAVASLQVLTDAKDGLGELLSGALYRNHGNDVASPNLASYLTTEQLTDARGRKAEIEQNIADFSYQVDNIEFEDLGVAKDQLTALKRDIAALKAGIEKLQVTTKGDFRAQRERQQRAILEDAQRNGLPKAAKKRLENNNDLKTASVAQFRAQGKRVSIIQ
jgi:hypothetical protein